VLKQDELEDQTFLKALRCATVVVK